MDLTPLVQQLQAIDPWVWLVAATVAVLLVAGLVALLVRQRRRRTRLHRRYGAEYEHTAQQAGSRRRADRELVAREEERRHYEVRDLEPGERERLSARWEALQASFVDDPWAAVRGVDELVTEVAAAKGYPDHEADPLTGASVDHPRSIDRYRAAAKTVEDAGSQAGTEHLRHTVLAARDVFETMLGSTETSAADPRTAFQALVSEDEQDTTTRREAPSPLYGPDGRRVQQEPVDRRR